MGHPVEHNDFEVINPSNEQVCAVISLGGQSDTNAAVAAAKTAFESWSGTHKDRRIALVEKILEIYSDRTDEMAQAISTEMGAPIDMAKSSQVGAGYSHIKNFIRAASNFEFDRMLGEHAPNDRILYEPVGVCGLITPWNWPMNHGYSQGDTGFAGRLHHDFKAFGNRAFIIVIVCRIHT